MSDAPAETPQSPRRRGASGAFVAYLLFALVATYPLISQPRDHVLGPSKGTLVPAATPPLSIWSMAVVLHQLGRAPFHLFDGNAFYPYPNTLAYSEHLFVPALLGAPALLLTGNRVVAYNGVVVATLALAGLGMYLLAREVTGSAAAAFGAGLLYAFHTWNLNELVRLQILSNEFFPFVLFTLLRFFARPGWGRGALVGVACTLQSLSCMYWALYLPLVVGVAILVLEWRYRLKWPELAALVLGLLPAVALTGIFAIPYLETARSLGFERPLPESLLLERYLEVLPGNVLYGRLLETALPNQNAAHFLGFVAMGLGLLGLLGRRKTESASAAWPLFVALAVGAFLLSLGPEIRIGHRDLGPGPYLLLRRFVPGFRNVRYPERFSVLVVLGLAPLVAMGLVRLLKPLGQAGVLLLGGVLFLEHLSLPQPLSFLPSGSEIPEVYEHLAKQPGDRVVAQVPGSPCWMQRADALPMYFSTTHWKRTVEGYTSYFPPTYNFTKWRLFHFPAPESIAFLERLGVDTVVVEPEGPKPRGWDLTNPRWELEGPFREGHVLLHMRGAHGLRYEPPAAVDGFLEVDRAGWRAQATAEGASLAIDGDPQTAWVSGIAQSRGDSFTLRFPGPVRVARISMDVHCFLHQAEEFPTHLALLGLVGDAWSAIPYDADAAYDRFFAALLYKPKEATLDIDIDPVPLRAVKLKITETDPFGMPWTLSEIRIFEKR
jgi:hypothetical protein